MTSKKTPKNAENFVCENCEFVCCKKSDYDRHLSTGKHKRLTNTAKILPEKTPNDFNCVCGKSYKHRQSYFNHKKKCTFVEEKIVQNENENENAQNSGGVDIELLDKILDKVVTPMTTCYNDLTNLVVTQQQQINEIIPKIGNTNTNCNNTMNNTTNNKFNMNIYLNEKCKDAISLTDFIDNLKITDADFDTTRTEGIVSELTDIFTNELRDLDVRKLPIHCSDIRRETFLYKRRG